MIKSVGQRPPSPLARFQNNVDKIEAELNKKNADPHNEEFKLPRIKSKLPYSFRSSEINQPLRLESATQKNTQ